MLVWPYEMMQWPMVSFFVRTELLDLIDILNTIYTTSYYLLVIIMSTLYLCMVNVTACYTKFKSLPNIRIIYSSCITPTPLDCGQPVLVWYELWEIQCS